MYNNVMYVNYRKNTCTLKVKRFSTILTILLCKKEYISTTIDIRIVISVEFPISF